MDKLMNVKKSLLKILTGGWKKGVAVSVAFSLFYTTLAVPVLEANLWETRKNASERVRKDNAREYTQLASLPGHLMEGIPSGNDQLLPESGGRTLAPEAIQGVSLSGRKSISLDALSSRVPPALLKLPYSYGEIVKLKLAKDTNAPMIFVVQDAHEIESAQRNIAQTLSHLQAQGKEPLVVGLEGASGPFEIGQYRTLSNKKAQREVWEVLMSKSLISGAEYFGLMADKEPTLWGVEDENLYLANVAAYRKGLEHKDKSRETLARMSAALNSVKDAIFTPEMKQFDSRVERFEKREIGLADYVQSFDGTGLLRSGRYAEIEKFYSVIKVEKDLDFAKVEAERSKMIKELSKKLDKKELNGLLQMSVAYRLGRIGYGAYYGYLKEALSGAGVKISDYPQFGLYVQYVLMSEQVNASSLMDELEDLRKSTVARLTKTQEQRDAFALSEDLRLAEKLMTQAMSPEEWKSYEARRANFASLPAKISLLKEKADALQKGAAKLALEQPVKQFSRIVKTKTPADAEFENYLNTYEGFYGVSQRRNEAMVNGLMSKVTTGEGAGRVAVLVAGGFHTPGLEQELDKRGVSYAVFRPRIGKITGNGTDYLHVFSLERTPLEKLLLGEKLFLSPPHAFAARLVQDFEHIKDTVTKITVVLYMAYSVHFGASAPSVRDEIFKLFNRRVEIVGSKTPGVYEVSGDDQETVEVQVSGDAIPSAGDGVSFAAKGSLNVVARRTEGAERLSRVTGKVLPFARAAVRSVGDKIPHSAAAVVALMLIAVKSVAGEPLIQQNSQAARSFWDVLFQSLYLDNGFVQITGVMLIIWFLCSLFPRLSVPAMLMLASGIGVYFMEWYFKIPIGIFGGIVVYHWFTDTLPTKKNVKMFAEMKEKDPAQYYMRVLKNTLYYIHMIHGPVNEEDEIREDAYNNIVRLIQEGVLDERAFIHEFILHSDPKGMAYLMKYMSGLDDPHYIAAMLSAHRSAEQKVQGEIPKPPPGWHPEYEEYVGMYYYSPMFDAFDAHVKHTADMIKKYLVPAIKADPSGRLLLEKMHEYGVGTFGTRKMLELLEKSEPPHRILQFGYDMGFLEVLLSLLRPDAIIESHTRSYRKRDYAFKFVQQFESEGVTIAGGDAKIQLIHQDVQNSKFRSYERGSHSLIYSRFAFNYMSPNKVQTALHRMNYIMRDRGRIFLVFKSDSEYPSWIEHRYYSREEMETMLAAAGFTVESAEQTRAFLPLDSKESTMWNIVAQKTSETPHADYIAAELSVTGRQPVPIPTPDNWEKFSAQIVKVLAGVPRLPAYVPSGTSSRRFLSSAALSANLVVLSACGVSPSTFFVTGSPAPTQTPRPTQTLRPVTPTSTPFYPTATPVPLPTRTIFDWMASASPQGGFGPDIKTEVKNGVHTYTFNMKPGAIFGAFYMTMDGPNVQMMGATHLSLQLRSDIIRVIKVRIQRAAGRVDWIELNVPVTPENNRTHHRVSLGNTPVTRIDLQVTNDTGQNMAGFLEVREVSATGPDQIPPGIRTPTPRVPFIPPTPRFDGTPLPASSPSPLTSNTTLGTWRPLLAKVGITGALADALISVLIAWWWEIPDFAKMAFGRLTFDQFAADHPTQSSVQKLQVSFFAHTITVMMLQSAFIGGLAIGGYFMMAAFPFVASLSEVAPNLAVIHQIPTAIVTSFVTGMMVLVTVPVALLGAAVSGLTVKAMVHLFTNVGVNAWNLGMQAMRYPESWRLSTLTTGPSDAIQMSEDEAKRQVIAAIDSVHQAAIANAQPSAAGAVQISAEGRVEIDSLLDRIKDLTENLYGDSYGEADNHLMRLALATDDAHVKAELYRIRDIFFDRDGRLVDEAAARDGFRPYQEGESLETSIQRIREGLSVWREAELEYYRNVFSIDNPDGDDENLKAYGYTIPDEIEMVHQAFMEAVDQIERGVQQGDIRSDKVQLRLSRRDPDAVIGFNDRQASALYLPMKGDPWQLGHVYIMLRGMAHETDGKQIWFDKTFFTTDNSDPARKPNLSSLTGRQRNNVVLARLFSPFLAQSPITQQEESLVTADGESTVGTFIELNPNVKIGYMAGADHAFWINPKGQDDVIKKLHDKYPGILIPTVFSERKGFEFGKAQLDAAIRQAEAEKGEPLTDSEREAFVAANKEAMALAHLQEMKQVSGNPNISYFHQPMDTSSTRVREKGHWWTVPHVIFLTAQATRKWGAHVAARPKRSTDGGTSLYSTIPLPLVGPLFIAFSNWLTDRVGQGPVYQADSLTDLLLSMVGLTRPIREGIVDWAVRILAFVRERLALGVSPAQVRDAIELIPQSSRQEIAGQVPVDAGWVQAQTARANAGLLSAALAVSGQVSASADAQTGKFFTGIAAGNLKFATRADFEEYESLLLANAEIVRRYRQTNAIDFEDAVEKLAAAAGAVKRKNPQAKLDLGFVLSDLERIYREETGDGFSESQRRDFEGMVAEAGAPVPPMSKDAKYQLLNAIGIRPSNTAFFARQNELAQANPNVRFFLISDAPGASANVKARNIAVISRSELRRRTEARPEQPLILENNVLVARNIVTQIAGFTLKDSGELAGVNRSSWDWTGVDTRKVSFVQLSLSGIPLMRAAIEALATWIQSAQHFAVQQ